MRGLREDEEWARTLIQFATGRHVVAHDDGSSASMHDLWITRVDGGREAVEVTAAADPEAIPLWKLLNGSGERWIDQRLVGGWNIEFMPTARAKLIRQALPSLLLDVERVGIHRFTPHDLTGHLRDRAQALGITSASQLGTDFPGSIYLMIDQEHLNGVSFLESSQGSLPTWIGDFLREPARADNLSKLKRSGVRRRHIFILVPPFTTAPAGVVNVLLQDHPPGGWPEPDLPPEVTDVWIASTWATGAGMRWSPVSGWQRFRTDIADGA